VSPTGQSLSSKYEKKSHEFENFVFKCIVKFQKEEFEIWTNSLLILKNDGKHVWCTTLYLYVYSYNTNF